METILKHKPLIAVITVAIAALIALSVFGPSSLVRPYHPPAGGLPAAVDLSQDWSPATSTWAVPDTTVYQYIEVMDSCGPYYAGTCVLMRSGPSTDAPIVAHLRTGLVLKVADTVTAEGQTWYKIKFDEGVLYPERVTGDWYVAADLVRLFTDKGDEKLSTTTPPTTKHITVDISKQMLYAYDGDTLFMQEPISTGLEYTPTPKGSFVIFKKTPSRYMQGPVPGVSDQYYDLPGVPWDLYFTSGGAVIHGAYWHDHFGRPWSHGCVNLPPQKAMELYNWADVGTRVDVQA